MVVAAPPPRRGQRPNPAVPQPAKPGAAQDMPEAEPVMIEAVDGVVVVPDQDDDDDNDDAYDEGEDVLEPKAKGDSTHPDEDEL